MWETALAFAIWGCYGSVLTAAHIDPALTAIARSAGLGLILTSASAAIARVRGPREITAAIPWRSGALWLSGILTDQERAVRDSYLARGLVHQGTSSKNGWVRIDLERPA